MNYYPYTQSYSTVEGPQVDGADEENQDDLLKSAAMLLSLANGVCAPEVLPLSIVVVVVVVLVILTKLAG